MVARQTLLALISACLLAAVGATGALGATAAKPDIIVIMVDDLGAIDNRVLDRLPNIRQLFLHGGLGSTRLTPRRRCAAPAAPRFLRANTPATTA